MNKLNAIIIIISVFSSCTNDKYDKLYPVTAGADPCDTTAKTISYSKDVSNILNSKCSYAGCHDAGSSSGGINLSTYTGTFDAAITKNKLLGSIQHVAGYSPMPIGGNKLPACEIAKITNWINQGSPNN